jgi:hypothetical protein
MTLAQNFLAQWGVQLLDRGYPFEYLAVMRKIIETKPPKTWQACKVLDEMAALNMPKTTQ